MRIAYLIIAHKNFKQLEHLASSNKLFARKFDSALDEEVMDMLDKYSDSHPDTELRLSA